MSRGAAAEVFDHTTADCEIAILAATAGAAVVRERFGSAFTRLPKSPTDFATDVDLEAEAAIIAVLRAARPADAVVGEESGRTGSADTHRQWLVDPLCGTVNFAARTPLFSVNVALEGNGQTLAAASADPLAGEVFWTDGKRAHRRVADSDEVVAPSAQSRLIDVNLDPPFPNAPRFSAAGLLGRTAFTRNFLPRVGSTTLGVAWVAAGRRAGYVTDGRLEHSVHFAAGIALCAAAGCPVTNLRGEPLHTGLGGLVIAADQATHATLIDAIGLAGA